ncbi:tyrosine-protein phosphatase non-receptor type substrate 1-like isoform X2 [Sceloporus undulatus]|nr:tyrosine-protein phosphatase non-receptor type substrate 1-like isoform X2 [Sceloporus undulatus]XP_042320610.1 tyrosine-protein phosphatase non-receptor type substrate 1-like isoform X2 [Sceloporus undulatus]
MDAWGISSSRGLLTYCLMPLFFSRWPGVRGQQLEIIQSPESLSVSAGEELTLSCTLSGIGLPGGVKWHRGLDRIQPAIYSQKGESSPRVTRVVPGSLNDFSITIKNVRPEDAGTYYCVKYRQRSGSPETEETAGKGTVVSVIATPSQPSIQGPTSRVESGASVTFNCTSDRFSPRDIAVTWWKDGRPIQPLQTTVLPEGESISYQVLSTVEVQLTKEDVKSQLVCQINHNTLRSPLKQGFRVGDVLRVPPNIRVETIPPPPIQLNDTVTITCSVENFYPNDTTLVWLENNNKSEIGTDEPMTQNWDGTSSLKSSLAVKATEERNLSVFACLVRHNSQPPVNKTATLIIRAQTEGDESADTPGPGEASIFIIVAVVCLLLVVLVVAIIYLVLARHHKGKDPTSVRLHESEKTSGVTNQEPDPNNVTYADLNFEKAPQKSPRQVVEISQQSEYASIQAAKPPANDENVTYADLDMVHLSKAPKRPAPKPEEASSEYASVQVQSK